MIATRSSSGVQLQVNVSSTPSGLENNPNFGLEQTTNHVGMMIIVAHITLLQLAAWFFSRAQTFLKCPRHKTIPQHHFPRWHLSSYNYTLRLGHDAYPMKPYG